MSKESEEKALELMDKTEDIVWVNPEGAFHRQDVINLIKIAAEPFDVSEMYNKAFGRSFQSSPDGLVGAGIKECLEDLERLGVVTLKKKQ